MKKVIPFLIVILWVSFADSASAQAGAEPVSLQTALETAAGENKKILVDVYAEWCPYCQRMHSEVYPSDEVMQAITDYFIWVKINIESDETVNYLGTKMTEAEFARALQNKNVPTTYFLNEEGAVLGTQPGYIPADTFSALLNFVGSDAYLNQSFGEYRGQ